MTETEAAMFERVRDQAELVAKINAHNEIMVKVTAENWIIGGELMRLVCDKQAKAAGRP